VAFGQKIFESLALAQLSFPRDALLDESVARVEAMLTETHDLLPNSSLYDNLAWAKGSDAVEQLVIRDKKRTP
jgi:hypothetical protein